MKQKDLEIQLTQFKNFKEPKIQLEQYQTPPRLVAMITWRALQLGDIKDKVVADFCSGTGLFAIAAKILGAKKVYAIEIDPEALKVAKENVENTGLEIEFIEKDVREISMNFDTVLMNSPFGVKGTVKDQEFLRVALSVSKVSYSLHLFQEKNVEFLRKFVLKNDKIIDETIKAEFEIPKIYRFHKKRYHVIEVAILRCI
ncbi:MAG: methyltransferase [Candidatus Heimdallarchaeota archaeon]|nr:methyltransferase [Candidatus Heimdallarchaeota archaeon]MCK4972142.1 methyltransferase [Candidatus Heimdallarchaeota archaeon]